VRLIAEPWDTAAYQLGRGFPGLTRLQWNGRFRDDIRRFVKSDPGMVPDLMRRIYGSDDLFPDSRADAYHAYQSVNYVASHDGFTLYDCTISSPMTTSATGKTEIMIRTVLTRTTVGIVGTKGMKLSPRQSSRCAGSK